MAYIASEPFTHGNVMVANADGSDAKALIDGKVFYLPPLWSPDGTMIVLRRSAWTAGSGWSIAGLGRCGGSSPPPPRRSKMARQQRRHLVIRTGVAVTLVRRRDSKLIALLCGDRKRRQLAGQGRPSTCDVDHRGRRGRWPRGTPAPTPLPSPFLRHSADGSLPEGPDPKGSSPQTVPR